MKVLRSMEEIHSNEQYFWDKPSRIGLSRVVRAHLEQLEWGDSISRESNSTHPVCLLCAPTLAQALDDPLILLDLDPRFQQIDGFHTFDIARPQPLPRQIQNQRFSLILCDPPFFNLSLTQLGRALDTLSHYDREQPLLVSYLVRRESAILSALQHFGLVATGIFPRYPTLREISKNEIQFYGNLSPECYRYFRES